MILKSDEERVTAVSLRGSADTVGLVNLLTLLHGNGHAGTLKLQLGERVTHLHVYGGKIYLPAGGPRGSHRLGALLVRAGKVNGRDLIRGLQVQKQEGHKERLGDVLVRLQLVARADLDGVIRAQFEEEICDLLFEDGAYFEFRRDVLPAGFADSQGRVQALGFDTRSILMEASRRQDEWSRIHAAIPSMRSIFTLSVLPSNAWHVDAEGQVQSGSSMSVGSENSAFDEAQERVVERWKAVDALFTENPFDGVKTVEEIVQASGVAAFTAMGVVAGLRQEGLIRPLTASEVEREVRTYLAAGKPRLAYKVYEWANESERLRPTAADLDNLLLRAEHLEGVTFHTRTTSERAIQVLSRLLRRGAPFRYLAREGESMVEVYFTPGSLRLHLLGPRRTHSTTRYLRRRRAISSDDLDRARRMARERNEKLDRILVEDGFVDRNQWIRAVKDKVVSGMFSVFGWSEPYVEVEGGLAAPPPPEEVTEGLVCEIPLNQSLRESLRRDLLRWKVLLKEIPSPDVIFTCASATPRHRPRRAHDLFDGRRSVGDLIQLARVAPLELVRFVYDCVHSNRIRRLTDREHYEAVEATRDQGRYQDAIAYCKSAISYGYATQLYGQRLIELRRHLLAQGPRTESRQVLEGALASVGLAEVVQLLHQARRSGTLKVSDGEREKVFYIDNGALHVVERPGSQDDQEVFDLLMGAETRQSINLDFLQRQGSVDESQVGQRELQRIKEDIFDAFLWDDATFEFTQNLLPIEVREEQEGVTKLSLRLDRLLMEAMGVLSEWDDIQKVVKSPRVVLRYASPAAQLQAVRRGGLGAAAYLFDGKHTLADVVRISGESRLRLYRTVRQLIQEEVLAIVGVRRAAGGRRAPDKRRALASGRVPRLRSSERTRSRSGKSKRRRRIVETEDDLDLGELGDSFAETDVVNDG